MYAPSALVDIVSIRGEVSERSKEHAWKACMSKGIEGSNPSLTASFSAKLCPEIEAGCRLRLPS